MADDTCMWKFPLCPTQSGYGAQFDEGIITAKLDGGPSFRRLDVPGAPIMVNVGWVLTHEQYCTFMGLYRTWARSGGDPFLIDLILETPDAAEYVASFVPGSVRLTSKNGSAFMVSAQLEALPRFVDPCEDICASQALLDATLGADACEFIERLGEIMERADAVGN